MPVSGDRKPRMLIDTPYIEDEVHVSPDGRWVAYNADESGRWEVYVTTFPGFASKHQISSDGGVQPQWRGDGRELFYLAGDGSMMGVRVTPGRRVRGQSAVCVVHDRAHPVDTSHATVAVTTDGQRFLGLESVEGERNTMTVLLNWLGASSPSAPVR